MASDPNEFDVCEIVYDPYLRKYLRMEDECAECESDFKSGKLHIDIWIGSPTVNGGQDEENCEDDLTPDAPQSVIRSPPSDLTVDGESSPFRLARLGGAPPGSGC
jgi:hypothetical protein